MNIHDIDTDLDINDLVDSYEHEEIVDIITTDSDDNVVVTFTTEVVTTPEVVVKEEVTTPGEVVVEIKGPTKTEIAQEIFTRMYGQEGVERKHIIGLFIKDAQLTKAGSATYYQNFVKKLK